MTEFSLEKYGALVTGSSRGIGAAIAEGLTAQGAKVVLNYSKDEAGTNAVAARIRANGGTVFMVQSDVGDKQQALSLVKEAEEHLGHLDILVTNHGITPRADIGDLSETAYSVWEQNLRVNLTGTFNCVNNAVSLMKPRNYGRIICISSDCAQIGCVNASAYSASKSGIHGLVRATARELASTGITVNAVAPGLTKTTMTDIFPPDLKEMLAKTIPLGRFGDPTEIAAAVVFLSTPIARYITGQVLTVDGGSHMGQ